MTALAVQNILSDLFASLSIVLDNLVIELGVLILIFLGWQYLLAELVGGLVLIVISSILIKITYPQNWLSEAGSPSKGLLLICLPCSWRVDWFHTF